jgi:hypothetical protein
MPKYYIKCGTLELIRDSEFGPVETAINALYDSNKFDTLDEYFYIDERGMRDYVTAQPDTNVLSLKIIAKLAGWTLGKDDASD